MYLSCIDKLYDCLLTYYDNNLILDSNLDIKSYLKVRIEFLKKNPNLKGLFFYSLIYVPSHLKDRANDLYKRVREYNLDICRYALKGVNLRVSEDLAIRYLDSSINSYNQYFNDLFIKGYDIDDLFEKHENNLVQWIDLIIYGIAKEKGD